MFINMRCVKCVKFLLAVIASLFILWLLNKPTSVDPDSDWKWDDADVAIPIRLITKTCSLQLESPD